MARAGVVFVRHLGAPRTEAFFTEVIAGIDEVLGDRGADLLVRSAEDPEQELAVYRHWQRSGAVQAVLIKDVVREDRRIPELQRLGLPFVVLGDVSQRGSYPAVRFDNGLAVSTALTFLRGLGHRRIARVTGPEELVHIIARSQVFRREAEEAAADYPMVTGDFSTDSGFRATEELLSSAQPPTAIIFDNDLMALGGLEAAQSRQLDLPGSVSLLAWDDSIDCQLARPALSALSHDVPRIGEQIGEALLGLLGSGSAISTVALQPVVVQRETTGPPHTSPPAVVGDRQPDRHPMGAQSDGHHLRHH